MAMNPQIPKAHGCISWDPPLSAADESQQEIQMTEMQEIFLSKTESDWNFKNDINPKMAETYPLQRKHVNIGVSKTRSKKGQAQPNNTPPLGVVELQKRWPFLFRHEGMDIHFSLLTGESFITNFTSWIDANVKDMIRTLQDSNDFCKRLLALLETALEHNTCEAPRVLAALMMIITYFKEDVKEILLQKIKNRTSLRGVKFLIVLLFSQASLEEGDLQELELPITPVLVTQGNYILNIE